MEYDIIADDIYRRVQSGALPGHDCGMVLNVSALKMVPVGLLGELMMTALVLVVMRLRKLEIGIEILIKRQGLDDSPVIINIGIIFKIVRGKTDHLFSRIQQGFESDVESPGCADGHDDFVHSCT